MKTQRGIRTAVLKATLKWLSLTLVVGCAPGSGAIAQDLSSYLEATYPGATVLTVDDIDVRSCGPLAADARPSVVSSDIDGDGRDDYGLLLQGPRKQYVYEGQSYDVYEVTFAIVLNTSAGYRSVWETTSLQSRPIKVIIEPGSVSALLPMGQREHLTNPPPEEIRAATDKGIALGYCEKSSRLFFWDGERIVEYFLTD